MSERPLFFKALHQAVDCFAILTETYEFIKEHRLWEGFFKNRWITVLTIFVSILFSIIICSRLLDTSYISDLLGEEGATVQRSGLGLLLMEGDKIFFSGGIKYLLLIVLEVLMFHVAVRTLSILRNQEITLDAKDFLRAEIRMVKVMIRSFILGLIPLIIFKIIFSILGISNLTNIPMFFVYSYYLGFAFFDNYNEQFGLTIKESAELTKENMGAAIMLGIAAHVILILPIIGAIIMPIFCAVAATLYAHKDNEYKVGRIELDPLLLD